MGSQSPVYFLSYFKARGQAEPIRWLLSLAGVDYREERIEFADWNKSKGDTDYRETPILEVNGIKIHRTLPICRYLAKKYNLTPTDILEQARLEAIADSIQEIIDLIRDAVYERFHNNDLDLIEEIMDKTEFITYETLSNIEKTVSVHGWIHSRTMTWCDIVVAAYVDLLKFYFFAHTDKIPKLDKIVYEVSKLPGIQNWLNIRPHMYPIEII